MYRHLGYYVESPAQVLLPAARRLCARFPHNFDSVFNDAFLEAKIADKREMKNFTRNCWITLQKSPSFPAGSEQLRDLLHICYAVSAYSGWGDYQPKVLKYTEDPLMTFDDMLCEALNDPLKQALSNMVTVWPARMTVEIFRTHLHELIKKMALLWEMRPWIVDKFERYMGDLMFRMKTQEVSPTSLTQFQRTMLTYCVFERRPEALIWHDSANNPVKLHFPDVKDSDPEIAPEVARLEASCKPGPWTQYCYILGNQQPRELAFMVTPALPELPIAVGRQMPMGPFYEMDFTIHSKLSWGTKLQFEGFTEKLAYPLAEEETNVASAHGFRTPARKYVRGTISPTFDLPTLEIENDTDATGAPSLRYSWYSPTMQRMLYHDAGADMNALLHDLGSLADDTKGISSNNTPVEMVNIDSIKWADLSQLPPDRRIVHSDTIPDEVGGDALENPALRKRVYEDIWYFEGGKNLKLAKDVDVTLLYRKLGNVSYVPALAQFFMPPLHYFLTEDKNVVSKIAGKLGLGVYDTDRSLFAISFSHNVAEYERITGNKVSFDIEDEIRARSSMVNTIGQNNP